MSTFSIQDTQFSADPLFGADVGFTVASVPRPYRVEFLHSTEPASILSREMRQHAAPLLLVDPRVAELHLTASDFYRGVPTFEVVADEQHKNIDSVLAVVDFLEQQRATRSSMLFVVGGGILQDIGAFAAYLYKRGIPWTFVPTTLLSQADSCVGGKTAINHKDTKNLLALFSAPRRVIIDTGFLKTLPDLDIFSGAGEIYRLCITGGPAFVEVLQRELHSFLGGDASARTRLIATALAAKRAVVERDEFELDLRRSMNYGHSFGHALESLSGYRIPHGVGVTIGLLVENELSCHRGLLSRIERNTLIEIGRHLIPAECARIFFDTDLDGIIDLLRRDKKAEGTVLKLATIESIGVMRFIDLSLDARGEDELRAAVSSVIADCAGLVRAK